MVEQYLLDTHALIWWWTDPSRLSAQAYDVIADGKNTIFVSSASVWEMATKHRKGKLGQASQILHRFPELIDKNDFKLLTINWQHAKQSGQFTQTHADPFDRMLVAQSQIEQMPLISCDEMVKQFPVTVLW